MIRKRRTSRKERPIELFRIFKVIWDTLCDLSSQKLRSDAKNRKGKSNLAKS